jgi:hypothetical protein
MIAMFSVLASLCCKALVSLTLAAFTNPLDIGDTVPPTRAARAVKEW